MEMDINGNYIVEESCAKPFSFCGHFCDAPASHRPGHIHVHDKCYKFRNAKLRCGHVEKIYCYLSLNLMKMRCTVCGTLKKIDRTYEDPFTPIMHRCYAVYAEWYDKRVEDNRRAEADAQRMYESYLEDRARAAAANTGGNGSFAVSDGAQASGSGITRSSILPVQRSVDANLTEPGSQIEAEAENLFGMEEYDFEFSESD